MIGATGGSGTRVFVSVCKIAGYFPGTHLNRANDALHTVSWVRKWLPQAAILMRDSEQSAPFRMTRELNLMMLRQRRNIPSLSQRWLMKNPRLMLALQFLHRCLPDMKFIHVLRDGRNMAFSKNQNQLRIYGDDWLGDELAGAALPVRSIAFWAGTNLAATRYGESRMSTNYLRTRFEDLCRQPTEFTAKMLAFLDSDADAGAVTECVRPPASIERWRANDNTVHAEMIEYGREALDYFGYSTHE